MSVDFGQLLILHVAELLARRGSDFVGYDLGASFQFSRVNVLLLDRKK